MSYFSFATLFFIVFSVSINKSHAQPFTLMSWNMQWLSTKPTSPIVRSATDYQALRQLFTTYSPDILAFQEVDNADALHQVVDPQKY